MALSTARGSRLAIRSLDWIVYAYASLEAGDAGRHRDTPLKYSPTYPDSLHSLHRKDD